MEKQKTSKEIARENDFFRANFYTGKVFLTCGVFEHLKIQEIINRTKEFNNFNEDNDPYGEHNFGSFEIDNEKFFWKIDYYDENLKYGKDPYTDKVYRVLTIRLASEY